MKKLLALLLLLPVLALADPPTTTNKNLTYDANGNILPTTTNGHVLNLPAGTTLNGSAIGGGSGLTGGTSGNVITASGATTIQDSGTALTSLQTTSGTLALAGFGSITGRVGDSNLPLGAQLYDTAGTPKLSFDSSDRHLVAPDGTTVMLDWSDPAGLSFGSSTTIYLPTNTVTSTIQDSARHTDAISLDNRQLIANDGSTVALDWSLAPYISIFGNVTIDTDGAVNAIYLTGDGAGITNLYGLTLTANQSVRRNSGNSAYEAFRAQTWDTDLDTWSLTTPPSSFAIGDIVYASAANTLSKLADVASGQPLLSGGVTTAPAYAGYTFSGTAAQTYTFPSATGTLSALNGTNTWTGAQNITLANTQTQTNTITGMGTTTLPGLLVTNTTSAAAGAQQYSPSVRWTGQGWKTNSTAASQAVDFRSYVVPVQGTTNPTANWTLESSVNGGSFGAGVTLGTAGDFAPQTGNAQQLGTSSFPWSNSWFQSVKTIGVNFYPGSFTSASANLFSPALGQIRVTDGSNGGVFYFLSRTATQVAADTNNYNPGGNSKIQRWSTDASRNITGLVFTATQLDGEEHVIVNVGSQNIVLVNQSASSTSANRFLTSTGADITLSANQAADIFYDSTTGFWRVFKRN